MSVAYPRGGEPRNAFQVPPSIGSKKRDEFDPEQLAREALCEVLGLGISAFTDADASNSHRIEIRKTAAGMNNWTYYASLPSRSGEAGDGAREEWVVRLYNNGGNEQQVRSEHQILRALVTQGWCPIAAARCGADPADAGSYYTKLQPTGVLASVFHVMRGGSPAGELRFIRPMGAAAAQLGDAMHELYVKHKDRICNPSAPMYHELWSVHPAITKERFYAFVGDPANAEALRPCRPALNRLLLDIAGMEALLETIKNREELPLPLSFVHGDLVADNFLVARESESAEVTGVLDFEFVGVDWRAMELAVCTSKFPEESDPIAFFSAFFEGFSSTASREFPFTAQEKARFPQLITLRILSNVIYFVGRALSQELPLSCLTDRIPGYARRREWLNSNEQVLVALLEKFKI